MRKSITFWKHVLFSGGKLLRKKLVFCKERKTCWQGERRKTGSFESLWNRKRKDKKMLSLEMRSWGNEISNRVSLFKRPDIVKLKENLSSSVHLESSLWRLVYTEKFYCCLLRTIQRKSFWPDMIQVPVLNLWRQEQEKSVAI